VNGLSAQRAAGASTERSGASVQRLREASIELGGGVR
jgi:hypothetical protein